MGALRDIDDLYAAFCGTLPLHLRAAGQQLAATLGLAPAGVPWSEVFGHEVTLGAPGMIAEATPGLSGALVHNASLAHLLAVIEAFGTDRILDGQLAATPSLVAVLTHARKARDLALGQICPVPANPRADPTWADQETLRSIGLERALLADRSPIPFGLYEAVSRGKQSVGLPASLVLAHAAGWRGARIAALGRALDGVWVGLQLHDDVIDWEDDLARGGAWAIGLARAIVPSAEAGSSPRELVFASGVLARMLWRSRRHFRAAAKLLTALGAHRLASWARERERYTEGLARCEEQHAGFANRASALAPWARELLA
jgi:hypothetical protein